MEIAIRNFGIQQLVLVDGVCHGVLNANAKDSWKLTMNRPGGPYCSEVKDLVLGFFSSPEEAKITIPFFFQNRSANPLKARLEDVTIYRIGAAGAGFLTIPAKTLTIELAPVNAWKEALTFTYERHCSHRRRRFIEYAPEYRHTAIINQRRGLPVPESVTPSLAGLQEYLEDTYHSSEIRFRSWLAGVRKKK